MKFKRFSLLHSFPQMLLDIICVFLVIGLRSSSVLR